MDISIDTRRKRPLRKQIADGLRAKIHAGELTEGQQLPPVRTVADQLGVNFNTVARAYRELEIEGLLITRQGRGSFVYSGALPHSSYPQDEKTVQREALKQQWLEQAAAAGFTLQQVIDTTIIQSTAESKKTQPNRRRKYRKSGRCIRASNTYYKAFFSDIPRKKTTRMFHVKRARKTRATA